MLSRLFAGSVADNAVARHMNATTTSTVYIVSHLFSYMDILLALDAIAKSTNRYRILVGVTNAPPLSQACMMELLNASSNKIRYIAYNTRDGNTSRVLSGHLRNGNDVIIWQHPANTHKSLYYLLRETRPRLIYVDIADGRTSRTINNDEPLAIAIQTIGRHYTITSREIDYMPILCDDEADIVSGFNIPLWKLCRDPGNDRR